MTNRLNADSAIPVLCYHRVLEREQNAPEGSAHLGGGYGHTWSDQFAEHLRVMVDLGMTAINHEVLIDALDGTKPLPPRPVLLDFDDNRLAIYRTAWPMMREHGFVGTVFAITDLADGLELPHMGARADFPPMGWKHLRELHEAGWAVGGHTQRHFWLEPLKAEKGVGEVEREVVLGRQRAEEQMGVPIRSFAYPGGSFDDEIEGIVMRTFSSARLWHLSLPTDYVTSETNRYRLPSVNINFETNIDALAGWLRGSVE